MRDKGARQEESGVRWDQRGKEAGQISSVVRTLANQQTLMVGSGDHPFSSSFSEHSADEEFTLQNLSSTIMGVVLYSEIFVTWNNAVSTLLSEYLLLSSFHFFRQFILIDQINTACW
ncbi:hypothetical protein IMY05_015G0106400 [Salix suchowensis]|nr:hypothetical protein IMY05_015G0106400 [Salix suchowensis]